MFGPGVDVERVGVRRGSDCCEDLLSLVRNGRVWVQVGLDEDDEMRLGKVDRGGLEVREVEVVWGDPVDVHDVVEKQGVLGPR